jgi:hypothetical protein
MRKTKSLISALGTAFLLFATGAQADLMLGPLDADETATTAVAYGGDCDPASNNNSGMIKCLKQLGVQGETYKDEDGTESGVLAGSYTVTYSDCFNGDCHSFTIEYNGGLIATDAYLVVKDGKNDPYWYMFDLSDWDGTTTIVVSCLWGTEVEFEGCSPGNGSISHVSLFGGTRVPEPGTMALLGLGLIGFGLARRRKYT